MSVDREGQTEGQALDPASPEAPAATGGTQPTANAPPAESSTSTAPPLATPAQHSTRSQPRPNPYVGPRSFVYGETLYGRTYEVGELRDLLIAERIVLLYSPSGAGKSSLLAAGLRPELEQRDFSVLPTIRVSHDPPASLGGGHDWNRYALSTLLSLHEGRAAGDELPLGELAAMGLDGYLRSVIGDLGPDRDPVLIFDQFEELFTLDPTDQADKAAFLHELGVALRDRGRWALFSMREDFIAQLDPYLASIPKRFSSRYRLDLLGSEAAIAAARSPAEAEGVTFSPEAANRLVDDLRRVRVQRGTNVTEELGPYVEPVQLQVVCRQLWATLPADATSIETADVEAVGNVDDALADFYVDQVARVAEITGTSEREIRGWIDEHLVSEQGFRTQALEGPGANGPAVLRELENAHLIRADRRRGTDWYELAHDRLVPPVQASNAAWREEHLSTLQRGAQAWDRQSRPAGLLLTGDVLTEAERWAGEHDGELSEVDREYLAACRAERERSEREHRASRRNRRLAVVASVVGVVAIMALVAALVAFLNAREQKAKAQTLTDFRGWLIQGTESQAPDEKFLSWRNAYTTYPDGLDTDLTRKLLSAQHYLANPHTYLTPWASLDRTGRRLARVDETSRVEVVDLDEQGSGVAPTVLPTSADVVQFSPLDDRLAIYSFDDEEWTLWDTAGSPQEIANFSAPGNASFLAFSASPGPIAAVDDDGNLLLWDAEGEELDGPPDVAGGARAVALAPDGSRLAAVVDTSDRSELRIWDRSSGTGQPVPLSLAWEPGGLGGSAPLAFDQQGDRLAVDDIDGLVHVLSLTPAGATADETIGDPDDPPSPLVLSFLPDGRLRLVRSDGAVETWSSSPSGWEPAGRVDLDASLELVLLSGNGERVLDQDGTTAAVHDAATGARVLGQDVAVAGATRGGRSVVARSGDRSLAEQSTPTVSWQATPGPFAALALSDDGGVLASVNPQGAVTTSVAGDEVPIPCTELAPVPGQELGDEDQLTVAVADEAAVLAVGKRDGGVCAWAGQEHLFSSDSGSTVLDVKADGTTVAVAGESGNRDTVDVCDETACEVIDFEEPVTAVRINDEGLVAGDRTGKLTVDDRQGRTCEIDTKLSAPVVAVDLAASEALVAVATEKAVSVFELTWDEETEVCSPEAISGFDLLRDEGTVLSIDLNADASRLRVLESDLYVHDLDVRPDVDEVVAEIGERAIARDWSEPSRPS